MKILPYFIMGLGLGILAYNVSLLTAFGIVLIVLAGSMHNIDYCKDNFVKRSKGF